MKVMIPVNDSRENVCVSFGRAPYFLIHNTETGSSEFAVNPAAEAQGGAGIKAAQLVVDKGADALVTVRCGQNAADVFKAAGVAIYRADGPSTAENLKALSEGKLSVLTSFHAGFHGKA